MKGRVAISDTRETVVDDGHVDTYGRPMNDLT
ncbi:hypothetical protein ABIE39_002434 [Cellulosimicrobium sp. 4261]|jgi:hypothetical protein|nr:hypothetical protein SAMN04487781_3652 [Cellulosimicrobium cellulans]